MPSATLGFTLTGPAPLTGSSALSYRGHGGSDRIELTGAQTYTIDLAMMPAAGLKGLLVQVDPVDADNNPITAPVTVRWTSNAVEKEEELSPGVDLPAFLVLCSPAPAAGITALEIESTANAVVRVQCLG
jgi:hypothetical protein